MLAKSSRKTSRTNQYRIIKLSPNRIMLQTQINILEHLDDPQQRLPHNQGSNLQNVREPPLFNHFLRFMSTLGID